MPVQYDINSSTRLKHPVQPPNQNIQIRSNMQIFEDKYYIENPSDLRNVKSDYNNGISQSASVPQLATVG